MTQINFETIHEIDRRSADAKDWTVMVYLAGNNNLSEHMAYSLESLGRLAASLSDEERARINLLASFDGSSLTAPTMYLDFSEVGPEKAPFRQPVTPAFQFHRTPERSASAQEDPGDALLNFIRWCTTDENGPQRKARNYALILSGHSIGFHGNTFLRDESSGKYFTLSGMRRALERANELYLSNDADGRVAILGFDSCLMSMVEVGYEFKDVAQTLIASEGSLPNSGWGYAPMLSNFVAALAKNPEAEISSGSESPSDRKTRIHAAARSFVLSFTNFYKDLSIGGGSIDISAWDLDRVEPLAAAVNRLGVELNRLLSKPEAAIFHETKKMILQSHYDSQTYMADQCVDIKDFCQRLIEECEHVGTAPAKDVLEGISDLCVEAVNAVDRCVLKCGFSGDAYQFSNGISLYFPWSSVAFALTDRRYRSLRFTCGDNNADIDRPAGPGRDWYSFLLKYVGDITVRKARTRAKNGAANVINYASIEQTQSESLAPATKDVPPFTKDAMPLTKDAMPLTKDAMPLTKDAMPLTKDAMPLTKDVMPLTKDAMPLTKGFGENGNYLVHFGRFKNYELGWDISGFADDPDEHVRAE